MSTNYIPAGYHALTPSIICRNAAQAIDFYQRAFGATMRHQMTMPDGKIMHAELQIADSVFMLSDEAPQWGALSPETLGGSAGTFHLYVPDVDAAFAQAVAAGGKETMPVQNQFWGDRSGYLVDPHGHKWGIAQRIENLSHEEMDRRGQEWLTKGGC